MEEQFEAFKQMVQEMDIETFKTIDVDRLVSDYMSGKLNKADDGESSSILFDRVVVDVPVWFVLTAVAACFFMR